MVVVLGHAREAGQGFGGGGVADVVGGTEAEGVDVAGPGCGVNLVSGAGRGEGPVAPQVILRLSQNRWGW